MLERCQTRKAAEIIGLSIRQVQHMAARGEIPRAAKIGSVWTFDEATLRRWIRQREAETCQTTSTGEERRGMAAFRSPDVNIDEAYAQAIGLKPGGASPLGSRP
jgi:phage terminase Nu1 subunit (DNA packaging protein)